MFQARPYPMCKLFCLFLLLTSFCSCQSELTLSAHPVTHFQSTRESSWAAATDFTMRCSSNTILLFVSCHDHIPEPFHPSNVAHLHRTSDLHNSCFGCLPPLLLHTSRLAFPDQRSSQVSSRCPVLRKPPWSSNLLIQTQLTVKTLPYL